MSENYTAGGTVPDAEVALQELACEAHYNGNDWELCVKPMIERVRAGFAEATLPQVQSEPDDGEVM